MKFPMMEKEYTRKICITFSNGFTAVVFSSDVHGIGLGLPLAKSIVEAHGGTISVTSSLSAGTTFTLNFFNLTDE